MGNGKCDLGKVLTILTKKNTSFLLTNQGLCLLITRYYKYHENNPLMSVKVFNKLICPLCFTDFCEQLFVL